MRLIHATRTALSLAFLSLLLVGFERTPGIRGTVMTQRLQAATLSTLCRGRAGCQQAGAWDASVPKRPLQVVELKFAKTRPDTECVPREYWVVSGQGLDAKSNLLTAFCNDGYGAAMMGEDEIQIGPNRFHHVQSGGSNWRWTNGSTWSLDPLKLIKTNSFGTWTVSTNAGNSQFDFVTMSGRMDGEIPRCKGSGAPEFADPDTNKPVIKTRYGLIPKITLPKSFSEGGWKTIDWQGCAARFNAQTGYLIHQKAKMVTQATMKILVDAHNSLYVEIDDPKFNSGEGSWLNSDHLEIWLTEQGLGWEQPCVPSSVKAPKQWGIRLSDGKVFAAHGKPKESLVVERNFKELPSKGRVRLKIAIPKKYPGITVIYSDSQTGKSQDSLVATSPFKFGQTMTMGQLGNALSQAGSCRQKGQSLSFEPAIPSLDLD